MHASRPDALPRSFQHPLPRPPSPPAGPQIDQEDVPESTYQATFDTVPGQWSDVYLPWHNFVPVKRAQSDPEGEGGAAWSMKGFAQQTGCWQQRTEGTHRTAPGVATHTLCHTLHVFLGIRALSPLPLPRCQCALLSRLVPMAQPGTLQRLVRHMTRTLSSGPCSHSHSQSQSRCHTAWWPLLPRPGPSPPLPPGAPLDASRISKLGLVLSRFEFNKMPNPAYKPGPFELLIDGGVRSYVDVRPQVVMVRAAADGAGGRRDRQFSLLCSFEVLWANGLTGNSLA